MSKIDFYEYFRNYSISWITWPTRDLKVAIVSHYILLVYLSIRSFSYAIIVTDLPVYTSSKFISFLQLIFWHVRCITECNCNEPQLRSTSQLLSMLSLSCSVQSWGVTDRTTAPSSERLTREFCSHNPSWNLLTIFKSALKGTWSTDKGYSTQIHLCFTESPSLKQSQLVRHLPQAVIACSHTASCTSPVYWPLQRELLGACLCTCWYIYSYPWVDGQVGPCHAF